MINYQDVLKKILLKEEEKFFHGLSFVVISLIAIHVVIYFNFYKFSSNWIENESKKTTFILTNNFDEKEIPDSINEKIFDFLSNDSEIDSFKMLESELVKESLGLENLNDFSGLNLPLIFQIVASEDIIVDRVYKNLINISENRFVEKYSHKDQLFEASIIVNRIKMIIFFMFLVVIVLFSFLVINIVNAALITNFKFLEMLQIMGASSLELAKNISQSIVKKIFPGAVLSLIFVFIISVILINLFGVNFNFFNPSFFFELIATKLILLVIFLISFVILLLIFLTFYLFYFFEKRFFDKT